MQKQRSSNRINGKKVLKELYRSLYAKKQQIYILPLREIENIKVNEVIDNYELRKESENVIEVIQ